MARQWLIPILILIGVYVFSQHSLKGGPEVSVHDAANLLKSVPRPVVVDLRDRTEFEQGHISGALSVPGAEFKERLEDLKLPKVEVVILYDTDDVHAREATKLMYESGYQGALTLKGGLDAWRASGNGVVKPLPLKP